ncbi:unnamed protein product [Penicillium pancosmium]
MDSQHMWFLQVLPVREVPDVEAGPMLCGGVTMYRALKTSKVSPGQWVVIFGAGGGLSHLGIQFAKAMGMRVVGIDGGQDKKALCLSLGVDVFVDFLDVKDVVRAISDLTDCGIAGVIVTAASHSAYEQANLLKRMNHSTYPSNPFNSSKPDVW